MQNRACESLIVAHVPVLALAGIIRAYATEFSAERVSDWLKQNGYIRIGGHIETPFDVGYVTKWSLITFGDALSDERLIICKPENVATHLSSGILDSHIPHWWVSTSARDEIKTFLQKTGLALADAVW